MLLGFGLFLRGAFADIPLRKKWFLGIAGGLLLLGFKPYVFFMLIPMLFFFGLVRLLPKFKIAGALFILLGFFTIACSLFPEPRDKAIHTISRKQFDFVQVGRGGLHVYADSLFYYFETDQISALNQDHDTVWLKYDVDAKILKLGEISDPIPIRLKADGARWIKYFENTQSDGFIAVTPIKNSFAQLLRNIPEALYHSLLRPLPGDPGGALNWVAFLETILLVSALIWAIVKRKKLTHQERSRIVGLLLFAFLLSLVIGWTTPVLGAIARYRIPVYVALLIVAGMLYDPNKKVKTKSSESDKALN